MQRLVLLTTSDCAIHESNFELPSFFFFFDSVAVSTYGTILQLSSTYDRLSYHLETRQLICSAEQVTELYMIRTLSLSQSA